MDRARQPQEPSSDDVYEGTQLDAVKNDTRRDVQDALPPPSTAKYVHPDAARLFESCPWMRHIPLFGPSCAGLGPRCTLSLSSCFFLSKGLGGNLLAYNLYAMFRTRFGLDGTRYQRLASLRLMGWSVKAFSACISDTFALFGYTKRWYCAGSCIAGAAFALAFALLPARESSANTGAGFMFLTCFCMANVDIMTDGHYSRLLRKNPTVGPHLVSWIWSAVFVASLVSAGIQGPLADAGIPQVALYISAGCQAVVVFFFIFNWYGERTNRVERYEDVMLGAAELRKLLAQENSVSEVNEPTADAEDGSHVPSRRAAATEQLSAEPESQPKELPGGTVVERADVVEDDAEEEVDQSSYITSLCCGAVEVNHEVFLRNWRLYVYSAVMVSAVVVQSVVTLFGGPRDLGIACLVIAVTCCAVAFWACHIVAAKAIVFIFLDMLSFVHLPGVMDSFYMAPKSCYPEGPHFTFVFYSTIASIIANIAAVGGAICFSYFFSKRSYWFTFVCVLALKEVSSVFDIILVKRWNLHVGIPDHAMYIMGDAVVFRLCLELSWIPVALLFSRICPRGSESIIFALASGFSNMGQSMAGAVGSLLIELVWTVETKGICDFSNVPMLLLVAHILIPLAVFPLAFLLLPRARMCDDLDVSEHPSPAQLSTPAARKREEHADIVA